MQKEFQLVVDIEKKVLTPSFEVNTLDLKTVKLQIAITKGMTLVDLTGVTVRMSIRKPDNNVIFQECQIINTKGGQVEITLENQAYLLPGSYSAEIMCFKGSDMVAVTGSFSYKSVRGIMTDEAVESKSEFTAITKTIDEVNKTVTDLREKGTGIDAEARQDIQSVAAQLAEISINVKAFGAKGDGITDDTLSIQSAIDSVESLGGGKVLIPNGTYMIRAHVDGYVGTYLGDRGGIALKDNIHLVLSEGAVLKAIANTQGQYQIIRSYAKNNVTIEGGLIQGERNEHSGVSGEWGYGISIQGGENISIRNIIVKDCWGDGVNLQFISSSKNIPTNVDIDNLKSLNNRRQGMSVEGCINGSVRNSHFSFTSGKAPNCGVDIEPWSESSKVENMIFDNCLFEGNDSSGMLVMGNMINGVQLSNCKFVDNKDSESQFKTYKGSKNVIVSNCFFEKKTGSSVGILFQNGETLKAINNTLIDCLIHMKTTNGNTVKSVLIQNNVLKINIPVFDAFYTDNGVKDLSINGNTFDFSSDSSNGEEHFALKGTNVVFSNNKVLGVKRGVAIISPNCVFINNEIHGCALEGGNIQAPGVLFSGNVISGAAHSNTGAASFSVWNSASNSIIVNNRFFQNSMIPVTGTSKSDVGLSLNATLTGLIIKGNTAKSADSSNSSYPIFNSLPTSSDNTIEKGNSMTGTTSARPLRAFVGDYFYDTTLNKPVWCKTRAVIDATGAVITPAIWVDATGTII